MQFSNHSNASSSYPESSSHTVDVVDASGAQMRLDRSRRNPAPPLLTPGGSSSRKHRPPLLKLARPTPTKSVMQPDSGSDATRREIPSVATTRQGSEEVISPSISNTGCQPLSQGKRQSSSSKTAYRKRYGASLSSNKKAQCEQEVGLTKLTGCQSDTISRTSSATSCTSTLSSCSQAVENLGPNRSCKVVLKFHMALKRMKAPNHVKTLQNFKKLTSSVDSLRDEIKSAYMAVENAMNLLQPNRHKLPANVQSPPTLDGENGLLHRGGVRVGHVNAKSGSSASPMFRRGNSATMVLNSTLFCKTPSFRCTKTPSFSSGSTSTPKFLGDNNGCSSNMQSKNMNLSRIYSSPQPSAVPTLDEEPSVSPKWDLASPQTRYLPGVGQRVVRTHKGRAVALISDIFSRNCDSQESILCDLSQISQVRPAGGILFRRAHSI